MMAVLGASSVISNLMKTMNPSSTSAASDSSSSAATNGGKKELNQTDFLNLLTTQLTQQNPLEPYDSSSMLQQMANLTSLNTNSSLQKSIEALTGSLGNAQLFQASQLVGHQVQVSSQTVPLTAADGLKGSVVLNQASTDVNVSIKDATGKVVKTFKLGNGAAGSSLDFQWDGKADDGTQMQPGIYQIAATGIVNNQTTALPTTGTFKIDSIGINQQTQGLELNAAGIGAVGFDKILKII